MLTHPLVTVVTVVFNAAETLERTICSIVNQSYDNIEYIIIDGGSTDGSVDIIKKCGDFVDYWVSELDDGIYDAMNKGVARAGDGWVIFMNAGDVFFSDNTLANLMENITGDPDVVYGNVQVNRNSTYSKIINAKNIRIPLFGMPCCHQSMLIKSCVLKKYPYDLKFSIAADFDNLCHMVTGGRAIQQIDETISKITAGGVSDVSRVKVYEQYQTISERYFGVSATATLFYRRKKMWEKIKFFVKKIIGKIEPYANRK
jgi:glycosyltransferase involved in cell wall biosynthesis